MGRKPNGWLYFYQLNMSLLNLFLLALWPEFESAMRQDGKILVSMVTALVALFALILLLLIVERRLARLEKK